MPNYQGTLDGLCGPYAIVNAFEHCGVEGQDAIFETACAALPSTRWPKLLWDGTKFADLKKMIERCQNKFPDAAKVRISYPFIRSTPKSNEEFWRCFDQLFLDRPRACCLILGLSRPSMHWIVAYRETETRISFLDTDPVHPYRRKNRSMLHAGSRSGHPKKWIIDRKELVLFEV